MNKILHPLVALAVLLCTTGPQAYGNQVPKLINYQGKLTNAQGQALPNGEYTLRFELFNQLSGGQLVWGEIRANVPLVDGLFSVILGGFGATLVPGAPVADLAFAFGDAQRFLQTTVVTGPGVTAEQTLLPRQQLASVPYAMSAGNGIPVGGVLMWWGDRATIPEGFEICDGTLPTSVNSLLVGNKPDLRDRFVKGAVASDNSRADLNGGGTHTVAARNTDGHALTEGQLPPHAHRYADRFWIADGNNHTSTFGYKITAGSRAANARGPDGVGFPKDVYLATDANTNNTGSGEAHSHGIPAHDNRPLFHELFFIIRVK